MIELLAAWTVVKFPCCPIVACPATTVAPTGPAWRVLLCSETNRMEIEHTVISFRGHSKRFGPASVGCECLTCRFMPTSSFRLPRKHCAKMNAAVSIFYRMRQVLPLRAQHPSVVGAHVQIAAQLELDADPGAEQGAIGLSGKPPVIVALSAIEKSAQD